VKVIGAALGLGHPADSFATGYRSGLSPIVLGGCRRALEPESLADRFDFPRPEVFAIYDRARSRRQFIDAFAALCIQKTGKSRWAEKTPRNIDRIGETFH
jgi:hypothetical protein